MIVVVVVERVRRNVHLQVELTNHQMQMKIGGRVVQSTPSGLLAVSDVYSCTHVAHTEKFP